MLLLFATCKRTWEELSLPVQISRGNWCLSGLFHSNWFLVRFWVVFQLSNSLLTNWSPLSSKPLLRLLFHQGEKIHNVLNARRRTEMIFQNDIDLMRGLKRLMKQSSAFWPFSTCLTAWDKRKSMTAEIFDVNRPGPYSGICRCYYLYRRWNGFADIAQPGMFDMWWLCSISSTWAIREISKRIENAKVLLQTQVLSCREHERTNNSIASVVLPLRIPKE